MVDEKSARGPLRRVDGNDRAMTYEYPSDVLALEGFESFPRTNISLMLLVYKNSYGSKIRESHRG